MIELVYEPPDDTRDVLAVTAVDVFAELAAPPEVVRAFIASMCAPPDGD